MKPKNNSAATGRNKMMTPFYGVEPIFAYLPKDAVLWEPAAGEGHMVDVLTSQGWSVKASELDWGQDYFSYQPDAWDVQVTNPPYSIKYQWLKRAYELGKPFALLLPADALFAKRAQELFQKYGYQMLLPDKRIDYKTPLKGWDSSAQFASAWFCWQLPGLPNGVTMVKLNKPSKPKGRIWTDEEMRTGCYSTGKREDQPAMLPLFAESARVQVWRETGALPDALGMLSDGEQGRAA